MEYSVFADESGDTGTDSDYYLLTLVFHNQAADISEAELRYLERLRSAGLPDIPFHMDPLIRGEREYEGMPICDRAKLLSYFHEFAVKCAVRHKTFMYAKKEHGLKGERPDPKAIEASLSNAMQRDIGNVLSSCLPMLSAAEKVKVYYDKGQAAVDRALQGAFGGCLSRQAFEFKPDVVYADYRLCQMSDLFCGLALWDYKFKNGLQTRSDERFVDDHKNLRSRFLKKAKRLELKEHGFDI